MNFPFRHDLQIYEQLQQYIEERTILPSLPRLSNVNPRIIPRKRAAGTTTIPRRPLNQK